MNQIKNLKTSGVLGDIQFHDGPVNLGNEVEILKKPKGQGQIFSKHELNSFIHQHNPERNNSKFYSNTQRPMEGQKLRVVTILEPPFIMKRVVKFEENGILFERVEYFGFCIDLMEYIQMILGFDYELYEVADHKFGAPDPSNNQSWNGMIGDIMSGKADLALAAMTITPEREKVVDFSKRFMDYAVGILMVKPSESTDLWSFIRPFDTSVWTCIVLSLLLVCIVLSVVTRISNSTFDYTADSDLQQFDRRVSARFSTGARASLVKQNILDDVNRRESLISVLNQRRMSKNIEETETQISNKYNISAALWFAYSALMQQGTEFKGVQTLSVKIVIGIWWFFALIVLSSYTANLAAFLTVSRMDSPIRNFEDLAAQEEIQYGTIADSAIHQYLKSKGVNTNADQLHLNLWKTTSKESNTIHSLQEGLTRVRDASKPFAFLWDVAVIKNEIINDVNCTLMTPLASIYEKGYGLAMNHDSDNRELISVAILTLQDSGTIERMQKNWWPEHRSLCQNKNTKNSNKLTLDNMVDTKIRNVSVSG